MAIKSKDEIMELIKNRIGDDISDEALELIEDISDTYDDLTEKAAGFDELSSKYNELDNSWRERYKARFYTTTAHGEPDMDPIPEIDDPIPEEPVIATKVEDLFEEV